MSDTVSSLNSLSNWGDSDKEFEHKRSELLSDLSSAKIAASPMVYADRQLVTTILTRLDLFRKIIELQGSIVECGVHRGNSLMLYYHLSNIFEPFGFNRKIIGFDTFEGFDSISEKDDPRITSQDFSDTSFSDLQTWIDLHDTNRSVSHINKVELVVGNAVETIPIYVRENPHLIIAMLYLDFDLYEPTKVALENFLPLVPKGGIVAFDEVNSKKWSGETIALKEVLIINNLALKKFYYDPWVSYYIVE